MSSIYEVLTSQGFRLKNHRGEIGLEIETESKQPYEAPPMKFWSSVRDGSLRDFGLEYILKQPVNWGQELDAALEEFETKTKDIKFVQGTISTSVHVHLNFLQENWKTLANFWTTYYLLENILIRYSGINRRSNLFCLPICDAEGELEGVKDLIHKIHTLMVRWTTITDDNYKYAALNLCNITKLGTMEVRSHEGVTDTNLIRRWVEILLAIKNFAKSGGLTPQEILEIYRRREDEIVSIVFPPHLVKVLDTGENAKLILKNVWYAKAIADAVPKNIDDKWGFPKPKTVYKEKLREVLDKTSLDMFGVLYGELPFYQKLSVDETVSMSFGNARMVYNDGDL